MDAPGNGLLMMLIHSVNVHVNEGAKEDRIKAVREGSIIFRFERPTRERVPKVIERPGAFGDRNHRIN